MHSVRDALTAEGVAVIDLLNVYGSSRVTCEEVASAVIDALDTGLVSACVSMDLSGNGVQIIANKSPVVRAAACATPLMARLAATRESVNVCCVSTALPQQRIIKISLAFARAVASLDAP
jgi:ribose 5-phosphate isomerase RpiB